MADPGHRSEWAAKGLFLLCIPNLKTPSREKKQSKNSQSFARGPVSKEVTVLDAGTARCYGIREHHIPGPPRTTAVQVWCILKALTSLTQYWPKTPVGKSGVGVSYISYPFPV